MHTSVSTDTNSGDTLIVSRLRRFLLVLTVFIFAGTVVELILESHTKEKLQWIPFILCAAGLVVLLLVLWRPQPPTIKLLRVVMALVALGGFLGMAVHLWENYTFYLDLHPKAPFMDAFIAALKGGNPLMAPGVLVLAAMLSIAATYYHPLLGKQVV